MLSKKTQGHYIGMSVVSAGTSLLVLEQALILCEPTKEIRNIQHLQERITSAIETVTQDMIQKTWQQIEFRLDVSRATNGAHIEIY